MANLAKSAAELYLLIGLLATSLLADSERSTSSNDIELDEITTPMPPEITSTNVSATDADTFEAMLLAAAAVAAAADEDHRQGRHIVEDGANTIAVDRPTTRPQMTTALTTPPPSPPPPPTESPVRHNQNRLYPLPHFRLSDLPDTRWGPFFEEGNEPHNITARVGSTVHLDCRIGLLQDKTVTWLHHKKDSIHLLTVGKQQYSSDDRISLNFRYPNNYRLQITYVTRREEGLYECQVATHPPKVKRIFLKVTAPEIRITDESGRQVTERYYKAGSGLELSCHARQVGASNDELPISWQHGDQLLTKGISVNVSTSTDSARTTLTVAPLQKKHSGNYTCAVGALAAATVAVHVLNGELPAAVHHGNAAGVGGTSLQLILVTACVTAWRLR